MEQTTIACPQSFINSSKKRTILSDSIAPLKILEMYDGKEYEEIIEEWCYYYLKPKKGYEMVAHLGGTGDKGRDVAAYFNYKECVWDNYQCKHYDAPLGSSTVLMEIGKLCHNCYTKQLTRPPQKYYFMAPKGLSPTAHDLLAFPEKIKTELISKWDANCKKKIVDNQDIELDEKFKEYISKFNFSIFNYITPLEFLKQFKETPYYTARFGELVKPRELKIHTPEEIQGFEAQYIKKILDAYAQYLKSSDSGKHILEKDPELKTDFDRQRVSYFNAESLKQFSRDTYPPECDYFELLKQEIYDGVIDSIQEDAEHGLARLRKVLNRATELQITNNPLLDQTKTVDRKGICHHLANEREDVKWAK